MVTGFTDVMAMALFNKSPEEKEQERMEWEERTLGEYNIFEGVECEVIFPEKQLKTSGSSGTKKGLATLAFGVIGWAATSGTSQNEENRVVTTIFQVADRGIVFKNGSMDGSDVRIPYDEIVGMEVIDSQQSPLMGMITLLRNRRIIIDLKRGSLVGGVVLNHVSNVINERACGAQYEEVGWGLEHATAEPQEFNKEGSSLMDGLERLAGMYKEGLLTDDEFAAMKKKLIEGE